jgi:hypothetical protein
MSHALFSRSPDLKALREEGYFMQVQGNFLVMREVPYVNARKEIRTGTLISALNLAGDVTRKPSDHTAFFDGELPCGVDGRPIANLVNSSPKQVLAPGLASQHYLSSKPECGYYVDYFQKMSTYANIISGPAAVLRPGVSAKVARAPEPDEETVFNYIDSASARAGIGALSALLFREKVAIVGLGGTGSYVLDLVAKTSVPEIRLFDADDYLTHNAFRAPGAPSLEELRIGPKKVEYFKAIYSKMHKGIVAHQVSLGAANVNLLDGVTFAFLCMDGGEAKRQVVAKLEAIGAAFVDVGMGLQLDEGSLGGILRVTASTPGKRDHVHQGRVSFTGGGADELYATNIQVADLNALNAALAVIKWKKLRGFYRDLEREHHCTYTTDGNQLENGDRK